jgi:hypothetical protein
VLIYFKRKNVKFVVEIWRFFINYINPATVNNNSSTNFRKLFLFKKMTVLNRSILSLLKILPMNSIKNSNFCDFDFELVEGEAHFVNNEISNSILDNNYQKMHFENYSDNIGSIKLQVMYMTKTAIFNCEDEVVNTLL